jgi:hypothetical protein
MRRAETRKAIAFVFSLRPTFGGFAEASFLPPISEDERGSVLQR